MSADELNKLWVEGSVNEANAVPGNRAIENKPDGAAAADGTHGSTVACLRRWAP